MAEITIYEDKCHGCGNCVIICPIGAKNPQTGAGKPQGEGPLGIENGVVAIIDIDKCTGCGMCVKACPVEAIEVVR